MSELAPLMNGKGKVAILAGNQNAPNLRKRVEGVKQEAAKHPGIKIVDTFYHIETPQDAAAEVIRVQNAYPEITGLGDDRRLAAVHADAAHRSRSEEGEDRRGRRAARRSSPTSRRASRRCCSRSRPTCGATSAVRRSSTRCTYKKDVPEIIPMDWCGSRRTTSGRGRASSRQWGFTDVPEAYLKLK